jgi:RNA 2',3'-cyclic 3'-phosphodiesterase
MSKRRLFIAINLPESTKKKLIDWQIKMVDFLARSSFSEGGDPRQIRWTKKDNLHITLNFIGYVTDDEMYEICSLVKGVTKKHQPFFINLERIILGPPDKAPRMFWVQGEKSQELANIQTDLRDMIEQRSGVKYNAFRPHITLAKFKPLFMKTFPKEFEDVFKHQVPVETIEVMQSELRRGGAEYTILESVELGD